MLRAEVDGVVGNDLFASGRRGFLNEPGHQLSPPVFLRRERGFGSGGVSLSDALLLRGRLAGRSSVGSGTPGSGKEVVSGVGLPCPWPAIVASVEPRATFLAAFLSVASPCPTSSGLSVVFLTSTGAGPRVSGFTSLVLPLEGSTIGRAFGAGGTGSAFSSPGST